ncbi:DUF5681 domain-containing protein [Dokdonella sp.]|uniref:DUF5681 domain-containing protein n=1 Tax=Dokdonella sp. TaxID=2291710 RepID=UPI003784306E
MSFKKGQSGNPKGKKKGQVSKFTSSFKEALRIAFDGIGGTKNLTAWLSCMAQPQRWTCTCTATRWFRKPANC